jgi:ribosomal protein S18 acetylase RimI-like enzyme
LSAFVVRRASLDDVPTVAALFDQYRGFYRQPSDLATAAAFVRDRLAAGESEIFLAEDDDGTVLGFVQLYPTFSSTTTPPGKLWTLNDLYVVETARRRGVGRALMERAERLARETGAVGLTLSTAIDNLRAQHLYEATGYRRETVFFVYNRTFEDGGG